MIVGGWHLANDGSVGPFEPNPEYHPSADTVPTDPVDGLLRRIATGSVDPLGDQVPTMIRDHVVAIGCDKEDRPMIGTDPDGIPCAVVVTAEAQKAGIDVAEWRSMHGALLAQVVSPGVDILLNPAGIAPFRLPLPRLRR